MSGPLTGPQIVPITARGKCDVPSGGDDCPAGVRVPADFRGQAEIDFGRAARPGEKYVSSGSAFARGEALHGMNIKGEPVAQVLSQLRARHITVADFNKVESNGDENVRQVPGGWYLYDAVPWAPGQVMLFVGATATEPSTAAPQSARAPQARRPRADRTGVTASPFGIIKNHFPERTHALPASVTSRSRARQMRNCVKTGSKFLSASAAA
jgi:hypothetical protein